MEKMKKCVSMLLACAVQATVFVGCGETKETPKTSQSTVADSAQTVKSEPKVDVDLSGLNQTLLIASIQNVMAKPDDYIGKTIKMRGMYTVYTGDEEGLYYHNVTVLDQTTCCKFGFEFVLKSNKTYPDDYPQESENIEVVGVFATYEENGNTYCHLRAAELVVL